MKIASHLGISLQRCKREHTSREYLRWLAYLAKQDIEKFDRLEYYMAQIAMEVRASYAGKKKRFKLSDFLIKFTRKEKDISTLSGEELEKRKKEVLERSKAHWLGILGLDSSGKAKK